jgi:hypothetical protein
VFGTREMQKREISKRERGEKLPLSLVWYRWEKGKRDKTEVGPACFLALPKVAKKGMRNCLFYYFSFCTLWFVWQPATHNLYINFIIKGVFVLSKNKNISLSSHSLIPNNTLNLLYFSYFSLLSISLFTTSLLCQIHPKRTRNFFNQIFTSYASLVIGACLCGGHVEGTPNWRRMHKNSF